jgi:hypothetical protein
LVPLCLALIAGAGPTGSVHDGRTWTSLSPFKNGIKVSVVRKTDTMIYWLTVCRDLPTVLSSPSGPSEIKSSSESWEEKPNSLAGL